MHWTGAGPHRFEGCYGAYALWASLPSYMVLHLDSAIVQGLATHCGAIDITMSKGEMLAIVLTGCCCVVCLVCVYLLLLLIRMLILILMIAKWLERHYEATCPSAAAEWSG